MRRIQAGWTYLAVSSELWEVKGYNRMDWLGW